MFKRMRITYLKRSKVASTEQIDALKNRTNELIAEFDPSSHRSIFSTKKQDDVKMDKNFSNEYH